MPFICILLNNYKFSFSCFTGGNNIIGTSLNGGNFASDFIIPQNESGSGDTGGALGEADALGAPLLPAVLADAGGVAVELVATEVGAVGPPLVPAELADAGGVAVELVAAEVGVVGVVAGAGVDTVF